MVRWDPFREMSRMREVMDRLWGESWPRTSEVSWAHPGEPAMDIYQTPNELVVKAVLPGIRPDDVEVNITGDTLTIRGEVKEGEKQVAEEDYLLRERRYGAFSRTVHLPGMLNSDKTDAVFENGVLTLTIPKAEEARPKAIKVKVKGMIEAGEETRKAA
ncbi:MAG: Hsp20/alpha crystallin family protein [Chloroflexi bacterium]|nr:Hsp20/alpha crystallin family protein [Chloroflexota bacterium]